MSVMDKHIQKLNENQGNESDSIEVIRKKENNEMLPDTEKLRKVVEQGMEDLFPE